jgi:predicted acylesterase/phospholipase RssA
MSPKKQPQISFNNIALSLSGGGYRASAFHLGSIHMLHELKLLDNVKMLSTASGGTITAVAYARAKVAGTEENPFDFAAFFQTYRKFLEETNIVEEAFVKASELVKTEGAKFNLIQLAAKTYEKHLFKSAGPKLGDLLKAVKEKKIFTDLIFNSTEFKNGNNFRFRASVNDKVSSGNRDYIVEDSVAESILLSDIIAASSCFPGVFSPFMFPDEFDFASSVEVKEKLASGFKKEKQNGKDNDAGIDVSLPLMDGGIFDNQGIDSILLATRKTEKGGKKTIRRSMTSMTQHQSGIRSTCSSFRIRIRGTMIFCPIRMGILSRNLSTATCQRHFRSMLISTIGSRMS